MRTCLKAVVGSIVFLAIGATANAQYPGARPSVTPYLNLYRSGSPVALNYYNLVKPELDFRASIAQLQTQTTTNQQGIADLANAPNTPIATGHVAGFMTQGGYFMSLGGGGGGAGSAGFGTVGASRGGGRR